jgi:SAM-dependent methyltransferase
MNIFDYNRRAWDHQVEIGNRWTVPVDAETIARARAGNWSVVLTPSKPVPQSWFNAKSGSLAGLRILALASGGGQQVPIFAAAGATVTVLDQSPRQLEQDRKVCEREGLSVRIEEGVMLDLSRFESESFDLIFHPCSNGFVPEIQPVWNECFRVLKKGGTLLSGFVNPILYSVDPELDLKGVAQLKYSIPYSDLTSLTDEERRKYTDHQEPLCFGHSLEDQLGGQLRAGFHLVELFEDRWGEDPEKHGALNSLIPCFMATQAIKP